MKIKDIKLYSLVAPLEKSWEISNVLMKEMSSSIVEIITDEGISGYGECITRQNPCPTSLIVEKILKPLLIGENPLQIEVLWEKMFSCMRTRGHYKGYFIEAISGVDIALWDIFGKKLNLPIYELLGGRFRDKIEVYASSLLFKDLIVLKEEANNLINEGYHGIKLKIGRGLLKDIEIIREIRKEIGDNIMLMLDANSGYDSRTTIRLIKEIEGLNIFWIEEPVPSYDLIGYKKITNYSPIPIAAGESEFTRFGFRDLIIDGGIDIVQPDVARAGGITEVKKIATLASIFNKLICPHTGASGAITIAASLHISVGISNFLIFEYMYPRNPLRELILKEPLPKPKNGYISLSEKPGLGIDLNMDIISKYQI